LAVLRTTDEIADSQCNSEAHVRTQALLAAAAFRQDRPGRGRCDARHQAILAGQALDLSRATYNQRLSRPLDWPVRLAPVPVPPMELDFIELTDRALAQNAEIRELRAQSEALGFESEAAASISRPQVQMLGAYTYAENPFQHPQALAEAGLGASWNLFDGGGGRHRAAARRHASVAARQQRRPSHPARRSPHKLERWRPRAAARHAAGHCGGGRGLRATRISFKAVRRPAATS
jgi:hypothetical protein